MVEFEAVAAFAVRVPGHFEAAGVARCQGEHDAVVEQGSVPHGAGPDFRHRVAGLFGRQLAVGHVLGGNKRPTPTSSKPSSNTPRGTISPSYSSDHIANMHAT